MGGRGCLVVIGFFALMAFLLGSCIDSGTDDCYTTGEPGSAQYERDLGHCIKQDR